jgi:hypothetical protein
MRWVIDRFEEGIAVLEGVDGPQSPDGPDAPLTVERPRRELPKGAREGHVLTDDGVGGGPLRLDREETAARAARIRERFERLKSPRNP